jgi:hypothetical protein
VLKNDSGIGESKNSSSEGKTGKVEKLSEITFRRFILSVFSKVNDEHDI